MLHSSPGRVFVLALGWFLEMNGEATSKSHNDVWIFVNACPVQMSFCWRSQPYPFTHVVDVIDEDSNSSSNNDVVTITQYIIHCSCVAAFVLLRFAFASFQYLSLSLSCLRLAGFFCTQISLWCVLFFNIRLQFNKQAPFFEFTRMHVRFCVCMWNVCVSVFCMTEARRCVVADRTRDRTIFIVFRLDITYQFILLFVVSRLTMLLFFFFFFSVCCCFFFRLGFIPFTSLLVFSVWCVCVCLLLCVPFIFDLAAANCLSI